MSKVGDYKIKLLILYGLLCDYTDEEHQLNTDEIIVLLQQKGIRKCARSEGGRSDQTSQRVDNEHVVKQVDVMRFVQ